jgi:uncharacterized protein with HEPN domain
LPPDPKKFLWDAAEAADAVSSFVTGKTLDDYVSDRLLHSAVERQLISLGEALAQLVRVDAELASRVPDLRKIVAFRNILVHGYAIVEHEIVWRAVQEDLPTLRRALQDLLS